MHLRLLAAGIIGALVIMAPSPAAAEPIAGLNVGALVWNGVVAKDALAATMAMRTPQVRVNFRLDKSSSRDGTKYDGDSGCRASPAARTTSAPTSTSWLPLLFAVGVVLVFVRRTT